MGGTFEDNDSGFEDIQLLFGEEDDPGVKVGYLKESGDHEKADLTVAHLGAIHEFGAESVNIPERSHLRATMDKYSDEISEKAAELNGKILDGEYDTGKALGILGAYIQLLIKQEIQKGIPPALKPATIRRKGSSKQLIDTGQLWNSIDWEVE